MQSLVLRGRPVKFGVAKTLAGIGTLHMAIPLAVPNATGH